MAQIGVAGDPTYCYQGPTILTQQKQGCGCEWSCQVWTWPEKIETSNGVGEK